MVRGKPQQFLLTVLKNENDSALSNRHIHQYSVINIYRRVLQNEGNFWIQKRWAACYCPGYKYGKNFRGSWVVILIELLYKVLAC